MHGEGLHRAGVHSAHRVSASVPRRLFQKVCLRTGVLAGARRVQSAFHDPLSPPPVSPLSHAQTTPKQHPRAHVWTIGARTGDETDSMHRLGSRQRAPSGSAYSLDL
eukprot:1180852-Prorocentrum_minimum.AAC.4